MVKRKRTKEKILQRSVLTTYVSGGHGKAAPFVRVIYLVVYDDGKEIRERIEHGHTIRTLHGFDSLNGTKKEKERAAETTRPDLMAQIDAAAILLQNLQAECVHIDMKRGLKIGHADEWRKKK